MNKITISRQLENFIGHDLYRSVEFYAMQEFRCKLDTGRPSNIKSYYGDGKTIIEAAEKALDNFKNKKER